MNIEDWKNIVDDPAAYEEFYADQFKKLSNYGRKFTANHFTIEDAIQETFLQLWTSRNKLANVTSFTAYCMASFRYTLLRNIKKEKRVLNFHSGVEEEPAFAVEPDFISRESDDEMQLKMKRALNALTPHQREAIFLRFYLNLSFEEVAEVLNITVKATYKIVARSLSTLKNNMYPLAFLALLIALGKII